jgi:hypothetical protein
MPHSECTTTRAKSLSYILGGRINGRITEKNPEYLDIKRYTEEGEKALTKAA